MIEQAREQLSALMDGELEPSAVLFLLRRMDVDSDLAKRWHRYQIARTCLRRQSDVALSIDCSAQIMARIAIEEVPVVAAHRMSRGWLRWASGGAIAAAVAVAALVVSQPADNPDLIGSDPMIARNSEPQSETHAPLLVQPPLITAASYDSGSPATLDPRLESYLIRHYEASDVTMRSGFMPYVFLVAPAQPSGTTSASVPVKQP